MSEPNRPTVRQAEMIDAHIQPPRNGQVVWALGKGGTVTQTTWNDESIKFFEAWYEFLKVPDTVKERMRNYYKPKDQNGNDDN